MSWRRRKKRVNGARNLNHFILFSVQRASNSTKLPQTFAPHYHTLKKDISRGTRSMALAHDRASVIVNRRMKVEKIADRTKNATRQPINKKNIVSGVLE